MTTKHQPSVAILMSVYNDAAYLWSSLKGICEQKRPAEEIILVDDGSSDNSLDVMRHFKKQYPQIQIIKNEKNIGLLPSINRALQEAKSDYIVWCAADDFLLPNFLKRSLEVLAVFPHAGICFSQFAVFVDKPNTSEENRLYCREKMGAAFDLGERAHYLSPEKLYQRLDRSYLWMSGNTVLARRKYLLEVGGFPEETAWHAEWLSYYIIAMRYGVCIIPEYLTMMREVEKSFSRIGIEQKKEQIKVLINILKYVNSKPMKDIVHFFKNRPCLFTPFSTATMLTAMIKQGSYLLALKYSRLFIFRKFSSYFLISLFYLSKFRFYLRKLRGYFRKVAE